MKTLFIVHVEPMFGDAEWFDDMYLHKLGIALRHGGYDRIIVLDSEVGEGHYPWLHAAADEVWHFSWGYEQGVGYDHEWELHPDEWLIESTGHEWTWIPEEIRNGCDDEIFVAGGARWECLQDWLCVLDFLELKYQLVDELVW